MKKSHAKIRAEAARQALAAYQSNAPEDLAASIQDFITDVGHLCSVENLGFLAALRFGIRNWAVERVDPNSTIPGPTVEIVISVHGLPDPPKPKAKRAAKPKKVRVPR